MASTMRDFDHLKTIINFFLDPFLAWLDRRRERNERAVERAARVAEGRPLAIEETRGRGAEVPPWEEQNERSALMAEGAGNTGRSRHGEHGRRFRQHRGFEVMGEEVEDEEEDSEDAEENRWYRGKTSELHDEPDEVRRERKERRQKSNTCHGRRRKDSAHQSMSENSLSNTTPYSDDPNEDSRPIHRPHHEVLLDRIKQQEHRSHARLATNPFETVSLTGGDDDETEDDLMTFVTRLLRQPSPIPSTTNHPRLDPSHYPQSHPLRRLRENSNLPPRNRHEATPAHGTASLYSNSRPSSQPRRRERNPFDRQTRGDFVNSPLPSTTFSNRTAENQPSNAMTREYRSRADDITRAGQAARARLLAKSQASQNNNRSTARLSNGFLAVRDPHVPGLHMRTAQELREEARNEEMRLARVEREKRAMEEGGMK
ncbi:hypothetical protein K402DRAFT_452835 [Aulographum hederae CBS 113979]|uniref:Uncharacterized protein n=1 Tax=Aulographum hederae CBS 113979 TaxID=1176131 RepID=A0A6G1H6I5_9PEZI|nr:hypothetical protein K402DRAFT_452835 [Aulographum hederae CBS 113979]